jgi:hypothetical protein
MTYACPTWEFAAKTNLLKLQRLQNRIIRTVGIFQGTHPFAICM